MHPLATFLLSFLICLKFVNAQQQAAFTFTNTTAVVNKAGPSECESIQFELLPLPQNSTLDAVPPFYVLSFELGGIGRSDFVGSDPNNLTWTVRHPQGTQILYYFVDDVGHTSNLDLEVVQSGNTTNCHSTQSTSDIKVSVDASQVATCDDLSVTITGGTKPYTITVVNEIPKNYTLDKNDDLFKYVNQVSPGDSFIIAASDSNGQWAIGTNLISSVGSTDVSCPGKESTGIASSSQSSSNKGPIIGGVIGGIVILLLAIGLAVYFYAKRRKDTRLSAANRQLEPFDSDDVSPYVLPPEGGLQLVSAFRAPGSYVQPSSGPMSELSHSDTSATPMLHSLHHARNPSLRNGDQASSRSGSVHYGAMSEIVADGQDPSSSSPEYVAEGRLHVVSAPMTEKQQVMAREEERRRQMLVQHQDADDVHDAPPAYKERAGGPSGSSTV